MSIAGDLMAGIHLQDFQGEDLGCNLVLRNFVLR